MFLSCCVNDRPIDLEGPKYSDFKHSIGGDEQRYHAKFGHCGGKVAQQTRGLSRSNKNQWCYFCAAGWGESHAHGKTYKKV